MICLEPSVGRPVCTTDKSKCIKVLIPQQKLPQSKYKCKHMHTDWKFLIDMDTYARTVKEKQAWVGRHWNVLLEISSSQFILWWLTFPLQINWCLSGFGFGFVVQLLAGFKINRKQNVSPFAWSKSYDLLMINIKEIFPLKKPLQLLASQSSYGTCNNTSLGLMFHVAWILPYMYLDVFLLLFDT